MEENNKKVKEDICVFCGSVIPDPSVSSKAWPVSEGNCCVECYVQKVMSARISKEIEMEELKKKYGDGATSEKRVFKKK